MVFWKYKASIWKGSVPGLILLFFISAALPSGAQNLPSSQQFTFSCDNNIFLLNGEDGYYTSGVFARYSRIDRKHSTASAKRIFAYEVGQMIYTAHSRKILPLTTSQFPGGVQQIDRPVTGLLFGKVSRTSFRFDNRMLEFGVSVGTIGENSFGRQVQESWHRLIGIKDHWNWVWDYQVKSELGANVEATYAVSVLAQDTYSLFQITPVTKATLGSIFTNVSQSVLFQFGRLRQMSSSSYWNSRLEIPDAAGSSRSVEMFLFYIPEVKYQFYNATIQGGMFNDNKGPILSTIAPWVVSHNFGVRYSTPKYCAGYHVTFQSKEAKSQFHRHSFGNVSFMVRF